MKRREINNTAAEYFDEQYSLKAHYPQTWLIHAESLKRAADLLIEIHKKELKELFQKKSITEFPAPLSGVIHLLLGLSIENILKGIYVKRGNKVIDGGKLKVIKTHKLLDLLDKLKIKTNKTEFELIERLEVFIEWAGRYPIPINILSHRAKTHDNGGYGQLTYLYSSDFDVFEKFYQQLITELK